MSGYIDAKTSRAPNSPRLYALIIGINHYPFGGHELRSLRGGVLDAILLEQYLTEALRVPQHRITKLHAESATRANILSAIQSFQQNPHIHHGDAIVIYFAGHGATVPGPRGWNTENGMIQLILPSDYNMSTPRGAVFGIPDRTIGVLLERLSAAKGDNITVILDCCYSGSGTRSMNDDLNNDESLPQDRGVDITTPAPEDLDAEILAESDTRGVAISRGFLQSGLRSHVLLAACKSDERAREVKSSGDFTKALLYTLNTMSIDKITYTDLIEELPPLPSQNPQCEGHNRNRIMFNGRVTTTMFFHKIRQTSFGGFEIDVGDAYGIRERAVFAIYSSRQSANTGLLLGHATAAQITPFTTSLDIPRNIQAPLGHQAVALQVRVGAEEPFPLYIADMARLGGIYEHIRAGMKKTGKRDVVLVGDHHVAKLGLELNRSNEISFAILDRHIWRWGLRHIFHTVPASPDYVFPVVAAAAHFDWHLRRESSKIGKAQVDVEFTKLGEMHEEFLEDGMVVRNRYPCGPNLINNDTVEIDMREPGPYGMRITNKTHTPLYMSLFYFDSSDLSIETYFEPGASSSEVEAPLKPHGSLTIGYGSGGPPFDCFLRDGQDVDVGTFKFYLSTEQVDLTHIRQRSPFGNRKGGPSSHAHRALWGTLAISIVQRRGRR
ncbi:caspase domain-containing protein [Crassisporium funariophilum]|nr:caspase domain-containing protein [Crassisporium funariophilum]